MRDCAETPRALPDQTRATARGDDEFGFGSEARPHPPKEEGVRSRLPTGLRQLGNRPVLNQLWSQIWPPRPAGIIWLSLRALIVGVGSLDHCAPLSALS
jgi:hypothetical protein